LQAETLGGDLHPVLRAEWRVPSGAAADRFQFRPSLAADSQ
jgi:hypothetical protein